MWEQQRKAKKRRKKALTYHERRDKAYNNTALLSIKKFKSEVKQQYGFLTDPNLPVWKNIHNCFKSMSVNQYLAIPCNNTCHNLLYSLPLLPGTKTLFGLGANFCLMSRSSSNDIEKIIE